MGKHIVSGDGKSEQSNRLWTQFGFFALTNSYAKGFVDGTIFTGASKAICLPGLNCYSCPGALGSCPIGSLQAVLSDRYYRFSFYILGFLMIVGAVFGRFVCGWLCPFGLLQDLLYRIPFIKKIKIIKGDFILKYLKYAILVIFVILLPLVVVDIVGQGSPWFCKWICPSGTFFAGWPLVITNEGIRSAAGLLFIWKNLILITLIILAIIVYRPFCRYLCPLGAIYGLFNPIAFYRYKVDQGKCTGCRQCQNICKFHIPVYETPNSPECIRCGDCVKTCSENAIS